MMKIIFNKTRPFARGMKPTQDIPGHFAVQSKTLKIQFLLSEPLLVSKVNT